VYLIDTNIFLEVMLSRRRKDESKRLLRLLRDGKVKGVVTDFTIHSIIVLLDSLRRLDKLEIFLSSIRAYKGLYVYPTSIIEEIRAVKISREKGLDMDDAIQYSAALTIGAEAIVSFDKDFDGLEIPRMEPRDIVSR